MENLRTHPCVAAGLATGTLKLHGWGYEIETGRVLAYDAAQGQFRPVEAAGPAEDRGQAPAPSPGGGGDAGTGGGSSPR